MKKLVILLLIIAVAVAGFVLIPRGEVASAANSAILGVLRGDVEAQRGSTGFLPAIDGELLANGDVVRSQQQGRAVLTFFDGSSMSVDPGSEVRVVSLARTSGDALQVTIEQLSGRTWTSVPDFTSPDARFEIRTPSATATVRGTAFITEITVVNGQPVTTIKTTEGEVLVRAEAGGETTVTANQQVTVPEGAQAPPAVPQPPTPRLQIQGAAGVGYIVIDPHGRACGSAGNTPVRQIPRCDVQGSQVTIDEVVAGSYSFAMTTAQAAPQAQVVVQGLRGQTQDFSTTFTRALNVGDLVQVSLPVTVAGDGKLGGGPFAAAKLVTSVCGAEATGTVFSSGTTGERLGALQAFAQQQKGEPVAVVITQADLQAEAAQSVDFLGEGAPAQVSAPQVRIDRAGLHLSANAAAGPLTVPIKVDAIAGASGGDLLLKVRSVDLGIIPGPVGAQIISALEGQLAAFAESFTMQVERVAFRDGCMAVIGRTAP